MTPLPKPKRHFPRRSLVKSRAAKRSRRGANVYRMTPQEYDARIEAFIRSW